MYFSIFQKVLIFWLQKFSEIYISKYIFYLQEMNFVFLYRQAHLRKFSKLLQFLELGFNWNRFRWEFWNYINQITWHWQINPWSYFEKIKSWLFQNYLLSFHFLFRNFKNIFLGKFQIFFLFIFDVFSFFLITFFYLFIFRILEFIFYSYSFFQFLLI